MYLMYVDESGDSGVQGSPTRFFALSGIVIHETQWRTFVNQLISFKKTLRAAYGLPVREEIHASPLLQNNTIGIGKHKRLAILRNFLDELAKNPEISITNVIVSKNGKASADEVFNTAWRTLFQRFENTLRYGNFPGGHAGDYGLVITDATNGRGLQKIVRKMAAYNPVPNFGGSGYRDLPVLRVIEDPYGKDSADTLPIQAADTCAFFLHKYYDPNSYLKKQNAIKYFERLRPVLNTHACRYNELGVVSI